VQTAARWLAHHEIWLVGPLAALCVITDRLQLPILVIFAGWWLFKALGGAWHARQTPADLPILFLAFLACCSQLISVDPTITNMQVQRVMIGIVLLYAVHGWATTRARAALILHGFVGVALGLALIAPFFVQWNLSGFQVIPETIYVRFSEMIGDSVNPNTMGGSLVLFGPFILSQLLFNWSALRWWQRLGLAILLALVLGVLFLTGSRGALLALIISIAVLVVLRWPRLGLVGVGLASVLSAWLVVQQPEIVDQIIGTQAFAGFTERFEVWERSLYLIQDFFFTGVGMGLYNHVVSRFYPFILASADLPHAHNLFLQVAIDLGVPGLVSWLAILFLVFATTWQVIRWNRSADSAIYKVIAAGLFASQVGIVIHGMLEVALWGMMRPAILLWPVWGLAFALWRNMQTEQYAQPR
jgi:putative inorganic carbon (HCO3(-)) transporter